MTALRAWEFWDGLLRDVLGVGDLDGFGVGCAIADDIELKSIIAAAVANLMVSPMRI